MAKVGAYMGWTIFNSNTKKNPLYWAMKGRDLKSHAGPQFTLKAIKKEIKDKEG